MTCPHVLTLLLLHSHPTLCCAQIAAALQAEKLILMTDVPGVLKDKDQVPTYAAAAATAAAAPAAAAAMSSLCCAVRRSLQRCRQRSSS
jgi:acetylglutamate kinase